MKPVDEQSNTTPAHGVVLSTLPGLSPFYSLLSPSKGGESRL